MEKSGNEQYVHFNCEQYHVKLERYTEQDSVLHLVLFNT